MPPIQRRIERSGLPTFREILRDIPYVIRVSPTARFAAMGLSGVLAYLFIGQLIRPGFTDYWWYQLFQTSATLLVVLIFNAAFADEGGMAIQTHVVIVGATLADTLGTAGGLYHSWGPYDKLVHFASGAALAALLYQSFNFLHRRGVLAWSAIRRGAIAAAGSFLITGILWELYEYVSDAVFKSGRVQSRGDTFGDLAADALGALVAVGIIYHYEWRYEGRQEDEAKARSEEPVAALPMSDQMPVTPSLNGHEREYALRHLPQREGAEE